MMVGPFKPERTDFSFFEVKKYSIQENEIIIVVSNLSGSSKWGHPYGLFSKIHKNILEVV